VPDLADTDNATGTGRRSVPRQQRGGSNVHKAKADESAA
jgi:hypothetical protein